MVLSGATGGIKPILYGVAALLVLLLGVWLWWPEGTAGVPPAPELRSRPVEEVVVAEVAKAPIPVAAELFEPQPVALVSAPISIRFKPVTELHDAALEKAYALGQSGDLQGAADIYAQILRVDPEQPIARLGLERLASWQSASGGKGPRGSP